MKNYVSAILLLIRMVYSAPHLREKAGTDWSPITTPDDWTRIQSPTTEKFPQSQKSTAQPITESTIQSSTSVCGRRLFPEPRIVGGNPSSYGKWPWQISLGLWRIPKFHLCGAVLLNENWAITAAHCVNGIPPTELVLTIGVHDLKNDDVPYGYQKRRVHIVAIHPQYNSSVFFSFDLALLRFSQILLPFQSNVLPICLPDDDETYAGRTAYVTGWGRLYHEGPSPSVLQEVAVPVINNSVCEAWFRNPSYADLPLSTQIYICTGGGICKGDSGSPMVIQRTRDKRWILAGIAKGSDCTKHAIYMRISVFREWINQILQF